MAFFEWEDSFAVGIADIDEQHRRLVGLISRLHEAIECSNRLATLASVMCELDTITAVIDELIDYIHYHFSTEEKYMLAHAYPGYDQHKKEHEQFEDQVRAYKRDFERQKTRLSVEIAEFLKSWWRAHILGTDRKSGAFLKEQGLS
jgi:hemerythrin